MVSSNANSSSSAGKEGYNSANGVVRPSRDQLLHLPDELLLHIAGDISDDLAAIRALSHSNQRLNRITRPMFYRCNNFQLFRNRVATGDVAALDHLAEFQAAPATLLVPMDPNRPVIHEVIQNTMTGVVLNGYTRNLVKHSRVMNTLDWLLRRGADPSIGHVDAWSYTRNNSCPAHYLMDATISTRSGILRIPDLTSLIGLLARYGSPLDGRRLPPSVVIPGMQLCAFGWAMEAEVPPFAVSIVINYYAARNQPLGPRMIHELSFNRWQVRMAYRLFAIGTRQETVVFTMLEYLEHKIAILIGNGLTDGSIIQWLRSAVATSREFFQAHNSNTTSSSERWQMYERIASSQPSNN